MSGGPTLHLPPFLNNASSASQTPMNQSNTYFGIAFKLGGHGGGPPTLCTSFVGFELEITIVFKGNKHFWRNNPKEIMQKANCWHLLRGMTLYIIWIEHNDKVFNHEQWHESKVKCCIWDELIMYAKTAWKRVLKQIKINNFSTKAMLDGFNQAWGTRDVICRRNNLNIKWNWKEKQRS